MIFAADIGGTNARLGLFERSGARLSAVATETYRAGSVRASRRSSSDSWSVTRRQRNAHVLAVPGRPAKDAPLRRRASMEAELAIEREIATT